MTNAQHNVVRLAVTLVALLPTGGNRSIAADHINVRNPVTLPARIAAERVPLGIPGDYKPCVVRLAGDELLLVMFQNLSVGGGKVREDMTLYRSHDGGKIWGQRVVLPLLGREPYFNLIQDGTLFITTHLLTEDIRNKDGYIHSYLHRSTDRGNNWTTLKIGAEDVPGASPKTWTHTSRNVLELEDSTLIFGVSVGSSIDFLWRSHDKGNTWDKTQACEVQGFDVHKQGFPWHAETVFTQAPNGDILGIARCFSGALPPLTDQEVPVGKDKFERIALFRSRDGGKKWSLEPEMGNYYGEMYQAMLPLADGRLLLTFTVRSLRTPLGVHAVLGVETTDGFQFDFEHDRLVLDEKTPVTRTAEADSGELYSWKMARW